MDEYDDGYGTQQSHPQYGRVVIDGSGRVIYECIGDNRSVAPQPMRIRYAPTQQPDADRPRSQVVSRLVHST